MTKPDLNKLLKVNTVLWLIPMVLPTIFHIAFEGKKFPWYILVPLMLFGCLITSNRMITAAANSQESPESHLPTND